MIWPIMKRVKRMSDDLDRVWIADHGPIGTNWCKAFREKPKGEFAQHYNEYVPAAQIAALTAERDALALQVQRARDEHQAALCVLHDCMQEIDDYIKQEYPSDHPVHERYRARDFAANPARMFLKDRIKETLDARALRCATEGAGG
jgi:hypothetical protein